MTIYWLLFAFPAMMALAYPVRRERNNLGQAQLGAMIAFVIFYTLIGALRHETGGDWETYSDIIEEIRLDTFGFAVGRIEPAFGLLAWISVQLGLGVYLVNGVCCLLLGWGVVRIAATMREPWLAVLVAVPYLLIVVGMGYIRQGAAIGLMLSALASLDRSRPIRTILYLSFATLIHATAAITFPLFVLAFTQRHRVMAVIGAIAGFFMFTVFLLPSLARFEAGYFDAEYDSSGALVRILMGLIPAVLVLLRWRRFPASSKVRSVWLMIAVANVLMLVALGLSSSSTAIDRLALFVSVIQLAAFGEIRDLGGFSERSVLFVRLLMIGLAAAIQTVWLVFATHSVNWVPYRSVLQFL